MQCPVPFRRGVACALALTLAGCVTDHSELAERPSGSGGGAARGSGGARATPDAGDDGRAVTPDTGDAPSPPPGPRTLTLVHGVIDSPWIAFCLAPVHAGVVGKPGRPVPAAGLDYGRSVTLDALPDGDLAHDGVLPYVVAAASADVVSGLDCGDLLGRATLLAAPGDPDATPPVSDASAPGISEGGPSHGPEGGRAPRDSGVVLDASTSVDGAGARDATLDVFVPIADFRVAPLPLLPEGNFRASRGYLLVAGGCLGGAGVTDPSEKSVCGELYSPKTPTLSEAVVAMPAPTNEERVTLSVLGGSPAIMQFDLSLIPASLGDALRVATRVGPGALRPLPPFAGASAAELGATSGAALVEMFAFGGGTPVYKSDWTPTLRAAGIQGLRDGRSYTLIFVGPFPGFAKRRWWNDPLVTLVENR
jgi:hypothetical protein